MNLNFEKDVEDFYDGPVKKSQFLPETSAFMGIKVPKCFRLMIH